MKNELYLLVFAVVVTAYTVKTANMYPLLFLFLYFIYLYIRRYMTISHILAIFVTIIFFYYYFPPLFDPSMNLNETESIATTVQGRIVSHIRKTDAFIQFTLHDEKLKKRILITHFRHETDDDKSFDHILSKLFLQNKCTVKGKLERPERATNPYQFAYDKYLYEQGITYVFQVENINDISCHERSLFQSFLTARDLLIERVETKYEYEVSAWLQALVLGSRDLLEEETIDLFQRWGLSHILAISGLHVGLITSFIYLLLLRTSLFTVEKVETIMLFFLPVYAFLAGGAPSVWRASLMIMLVIIIRKSQLRMNYADIVSIVFLCLVAIDRMIIYDVGFQFSFAVTYSLIFSRKLIQQTKSNVFRLMQISFISQMAILPLQIEYFHYFQPLSILINCIIVPYFSFFVIPLMFFLFLILPFPAIMTLPLEHIFKYCQHFLLRFLALIDQYIDYPFIIAELNVVEICFYYVILILFMQALEKNKRKRSLSYGIVLVSVVCIFTLKPYFSPVGVVTMLDVGQGDAIVIELPYRKGVFMIDAGATFSFQDEEASDRIYKNIIKPYLYGRGIHTIDTIFLSHAHLDHFGSVPFIIDEINVEEIVVSPFFDRTILKEWAEKGIDIAVASIPGTYEHNGHTFYFLSPEDDLHSENDNSLVIFTTFANKSWLFTGDMEEKAEQHLLRSFPHISFDVLKVAHHGSHTSTNETFLENARPKIALISVGKNNRYGHPAPEVIKRLAEKNIHVYRTDEDGAIQYFFTKESGSFVPFLKR